MVFIGEFFLSHGLDSRDTRSLVRRPFAEYGDGLATMAKRFVQT